MGALLGTMVLMTGSAGAQQVRTPVSPTPVYVGPELTPATLARVQEEAARVLFWDQAERDANFPHMERRFPAQVVKAPGRARPLPQGKPLALPAAEIDAFIRDTNIAGLLVLDHGRVRLERYARGLTPAGHWASFSVAKSFTSTLVGAAIRDGHIGSVADPVTRYIPELRGSAYDGVTIEQILTMTSGVKWNENYTDPDSDVAKFGSEPARPGEDATVNYLRRLPREAAPGTKWVYKTGETNLIGVLVSRATKLPLANYAAARIAAPAGFERDGMWQVSTTGQAIGGCCINLSLRDYGRMGQFVVDGGMGQVPAGWFDRALTPHHRFGTSGRGYGYQWWIYPEGAAAEGISGQGIFVDRAHQIVVVMLAAWPKATDPRLGQVSDDFTRRIAASIVSEGRPRAPRR